MQMQLEKAQENYSHISQIRVQAEEQLQKLQQTHAEEEQLTAQERLKVRYLLLDMHNDKYEVWPPHTKVCTEHLKTYSR